MPGTKAGWIKTKATIIDRYFDGSEEAYLEWVSERNSRGGQNSAASPDHYGFHKMTKAKVSAAGRKGGRSRRLDSLTI